MKGRTTRSFWTLTAESGEIVLICRQCGRGWIVLKPQRKKTQKGRVVTDPVTGLPVLSAGKDAPQLGSREVDEILAEFPCAKSQRNALQTGFLGPHLKREMWGTRFSSPPQERDVVHQA